MAYLGYRLKDADHDLKSKVWWKGRKIPNADPPVWMHDVCGNTIRWADHGNTDSKHGWEIDHIHPKEHGGKTVIENLQPLQWAANRRKGDSLNWRCA